MSLSIMAVEREKYIYICPEDNDSGTASMGG